MIKVHAFKFNQTQDMNIVLKSFTIEFSFLSLWDRLRFVGKILLKRDIEETGCWTSKQTSEITIIKSLKSERL